MSAYTPPQDTTTVKYSRYDRFKAAVTILSDVLNDPEIEPQNTDQFKDLEERLWNGIVELALISTGGSSGGVVNRADTLVIMRTIPSIAQNKFCFLLGELSAYDGGGGVYAWEVDPTAIAVDGPMTDVVPNDRATAASSDKGYWKKFA